MEYRRQKTTEVKRIDPEGSAYAIRIVKRLGRAGWQLITQSGWLSGNLPVRKNSGIGNQRPSGDFSPPSSAGGGAFFPRPATWQALPAHVEIPILGRTIPWMTIQRTMTPIKMSHSILISSLFPYFHALRCPGGTGPELYRRRPVSRSFPLNRLNPGVTRPAGFIKPLYFYRLTTRTGFLDLRITFSETDPRNISARLLFPWDPRTITEAFSSSATLRISPKGTPDSRRSLTR